MKKLVSSALVFGGALVASLAYSPRAEACGGCFVSQSENTQVTGHRMALSVSMDQTTLYDQITYTGAPESFAWILPIRGQVDVGLSSDALFATLESMTQVTINSPVINCNTGNSCANGAAGDGFEGGAGGGAEGPPSVEVIAQEVVGPYETVQLASDDPDALVAWLTERGYTIPADIEPVIDAYVAEGFAFLAMRLVPGEGIDSMRPVRITSPGAGAGLPLRMVAAGTGANTAITLWVLGEGRYEPQNFPSFVIEQSELVWDWDAAKSNYTDLRAARFAQSNGTAWHAEAAEKLYDTWAFSSLIEQASWDPIGSGYGDDMGMGAVEAAQEDVDTLLAGIDTGNIWITRISSELSRAALANDLVLEAASNQSSLNRWFDVQASVGTPPECPPPPPPCDDFGLGDGNYGGDGSNILGSNSGCSTANVREAAPFGLALALGLVGLASRRRRRGV
jgi:MYXO-CTERM domain-containing protein